MILALWLLWGLGVFAVWLILAGLAMLAYRVCCRLVRGEWP